jgi:hypothetical protein
MSGAAQAFSRRLISRSTASRMKSDCFSPSASNAFTRSSVPSRKRAIVCSPLIRGLPTSERVAGTINSVEPCILLVPPIDNVSGTTYVGDTTYEVKTMQSLYTVAVNDLIIFVAFDNAEAQPRRRHRRRLASCGVSEIDELPLVDHYGFLCAPRTPASLFPWLADVKPEIADVFLTAPYVMSEAERERREDCG